MWSAPNSIRDYESPHIAKQKPASFSLLIQVKIDVFHEIFLLKIEFYILKTSLIIRIKHLY